MKNNILIMLACLMLVSFDTMAQTKAQQIAQSRELLHIWVGGAYGTKAGIQKETFEYEPAFGGNIGIEFLIGDYIGLATGYTSYSKIEIEDSSLGNTTIGYNSIDVDVRGYYYKDAVDAYAFLGYSSFLAFNEFLGVSESIGEHCYNAGLGVNIPINYYLAGNIQGKYQAPFDSETLLMESHFVINAGLVLVLSY